MLVGRDAELDQVEDRAATSRLVTVVGPGGVGKTALARAVLARPGPTSGRRVLEVDLTRVEDPTSLAGVVAAQLGFDSFGALLAAPADHPTIVLLDNCEHVLDAVASVVVRLLGACDQVTVIATSRSPLDVPGESVVSLAPLPLPRRGEDPTTFAAVQLFLRRARDAGAPADDLDVEQVAELCRRLDGVPLALEIAAARLRTSSLTEITSRLASTIDVLQRPRFRGDPRHRSLADAIRWSFDLLPAGQAQLFERLSVFCGPFTAASARALTDDPDAFAGDLDDLVDASLVVVDDRRDTTRYRLLDTVRRFARDQLERNGGKSDAYDRFVDHVLRSVADTLAGAQSVWRPQLVHDLVAMYDDMAEALEYAIACDESPARARRLSGSMWPIVHQAHAEEIAELCRRAAERWPPDGSAIGALSAAAHATAEYVTGNPAASVAIAEPSLAGLEKTSVPMVTLHRVLGQSRRALGDLPGAERTFRDGARIAHDAEWTAMALELDIAAALVVVDRGEPERAVAEIEEVIRRARSLDSAITTSWAHTALGWLLLRTDAGAARRSIVDALDDARRIDYPIAIAVGLRSLAYADLMTGRPRAAVDSGQALLDDLLGRGALSNARLLLDTVAAIAFAHDHPAWERLAATARAQPITTLVVAGPDPLPIPPTDVAPLTRRDAVAIARDVLAELAVAAPSAPVATGAAPAPRPAPTPSIRGLGGVVEFTFGGRTVAVRDTKGVGDIVRLIAAAGAEVHALDLAGAAVEQSSTGEVIDSAARRQYEDRIRALQADIEEAESNNDYERAYRHQVELDELIEHLAAALGHTNRSRRGVDTAERARSAVTHRVRNGIRQLAKVHPRLGHHLTHAVRTGTWFAYRPEHPTAWEVDVGPSRGRTIAT